MLNIHVCKDFPEGCLTVIDDYFNRRKKKEWFNRQDVKDIILAHWLRCHVFSQNG